MLLLMGQISDRFQVIKISDSGSGSGGHISEHEKFTFSSVISTYNETCNREEGVIIVNDSKMVKKPKATGLEERPGTRGP